MPHVRYERSSFASSTCTYSSRIGGRELFEQVDFPGRQVQAIDPRARGKPRGEAILEEDAATVGGECERAAPALEGKTTRLPLSERQDHDLGTIENGDAIGGHRECPACVRQATHR